MTIGFWISVYDIVVLFDPATVIYDLTRRCSQLSDHWHRQLFYFVPFFYTLERNRPSAPIAQRNYQMSDHGHDFYVTSEQYWIFQVLVYHGWTLFAVAAVLNLPKLAPAIVPKRQSGIRGKTA